MKLQRRWKSSGHRIRAFQRDRAYNHCSDGQVTADLNTHLIQKRRGKPSSIRTYDHSKSDLNFRGDNKQDILV